MITKQRKTHGININSTNNNSNNSNKGHMNVCIAQAYYSYKWYSQVSSELKEKLPPLNDCDSIGVAQSKYKAWLKYHAFINAERKGRIFFRDAYVPVEKRDVGHEHQIKLCEIATNNAYDNLTKLAKQLVDLNLILEQKEKQLQQLIENEEHEVNGAKNGNASKVKAKIKKAKNNKGKKSQVTSSVPTTPSGTIDVEADIDTIIQEVQAHANAVEIRACMDVAQLILDVCPEFCARDEMIPGSIDYVAMMEILLLNQSCCKSRYGNAVWNKTTFLQNYNPVTLYKSVHHVNTQFKLLRHIKKLSKVKMLMPVMDDFIQFILRKTTSLGQIKMHSPNEEGVMSSKEFDTFFESTLQEILVHLVYTSNYENNDKTKRDKMQITFDGIDNDNNIMNESGKGPEDQSDCGDKSIYSSSEEIDDAEDVEQTIDYIVSISIYQTSTECIAHRGNKIAHLKNEQAALNVIWILILCIQNVEDLLQLPVAIQKFKDRLDPNKPKVRSCRSCKCAKRHVDDEDKIAFFDAWEDKYEKQEDFTKSTIRKLIRDLSSCELQLLHSIMKKPRSRCCIGHVSRTLNTLRVEYTGEEE